MKKAFVLLVGIIMISGLLLISCQKKEEAREGVAVQTYDKAVDTMDEYKKKNEEAAGQVKEEAAGYGEKAKEDAAGYGH